MRRLAEEATCGAWRRTHLSRHAGGVELRGRDAELGQERGELRGGGGGGRQAGAQDQAGRAAAVREEHHGCLRIWTGDGQPFYRTSRARDVAHDARTVVLTPRPLFGGYYTQFKRLGN